ncbi:hypothetical protein HNR01_001762 [Methylorubrum rhodesianum]|uniref:hypothetical protein n=1 Tax=Methylorubrum rhodesianum TaxID=29427 RepID=UPI0016187781|nr:hypothetical protein [Methylorubrum rhodesianum]MBB5762142.1 hypothetical protein [Methylorubrum rhodesianum]
MKGAAFAFAANLPSLAFVIAAGLIAWHGQDGWGWFILGAILTHCSVRWKTDDGEDDK